MMFPYFVKYSRNSKNRLTMKNVSIFLKNTFKYTLCFYCSLETLTNVVGYPAFINGKSMQPTLNPTTPVSSDSWFKSWFLSDMVWVNCWRARNFDIRRGDLIVYISPKAPNETLIKRVIATEGDIVDTNGKYDLSRLRIPAGHVWVHGDNRRLSVDSNTYGPVSLGLVIGVASQVIWPLDRVSDLDKDSSYHYLHEDTYVTKKEDLLSSNSHHGYISQERSWMYKLKVLKNFIFD